MTDIDSPQVFDDAAQSVGALVARVSNVAAAFNYANGLTCHGETVVAAPGVASYSGAVVPETVEIVPTDIDTESLGDIAVGMVRARAAVAETGSVVLDSGSVGDRVVGMLPDRRKLSTFLRRLVRGFIGSGRPPLVC